MADREVSSTPGSGWPESSSLPRLLDRIGRWRDELDAVLAAVLWRTEAVSVYLAASADLAAAEAHVHRVLSDVVRSRRTSFEVSSMPRDGDGCGLDVLVWSSSAGAAVALAFAPLHDGAVVRRRAEGEARSLLADLTVAPATPVAPPRRHTVVRISRDGRPLSWPSGIDLAADGDGADGDAWPAATRLADAVAALQQGGHHVVEVAVPAPDGGRSRMRLVLQRSTGGGAEGMLFPDEVPVAVLPPHLSARLTPREREIASMLVGGRRSSDIASELFISWHTCRNHTKSIFGKLGVHTLAELVDLVRSAGSVPVADGRS